MAIDMETYDGGPYYPRREPERKFKWTDPLWSIATLFIIIAVIANWDTITLPWTYMVRCFHYLLSFL